MSANISSIDYGTSFTDAALDLSWQGFAVFPLTPREKIPLKGSKGFKDATTDSDQIEQWWTKTPDANIGLATGSLSNIFVLDVDGPEGEESLRALEAEYGALPETRQSSTGRGRHALFRDPGGLGNSAGKLGPKLDTRGDGGYIVAPPSIHPSGERYEWTNDLPVADAPDWLIDKLRAPKQSDAPAAANDNGIGEGGRNSSLASIAGSLRQKGIEGDKLESALLGINETSCDPPLDPREVSRIADSISRYPAEQNFPCTDLGNTQRFIALHGKSLHYVPLWKKWLVYDGTRWVIDDKLRVPRLAREVIDAIALEASYAEANGDDKRASALRKYAVRSQARPKLDAIEKLSQAEISISPDILDRDPWLFNVLNGTIDLKTDIFRPHDRADFITMMAPCEFDPDARAPIWEAFLERIFEDKEEVQSFVRRLCGYSLTGDTSEQYLFLLYGTGANGKSTFVETFLTLLGDYGNKTAMQTFLEQKNEGARNDLAGLRSSRMVSAVEVGKGKFLNEALVKEVTGGDRVSARFLYGEFFEYTPQYKILLAANDKPRIRGGDEGIWRRMCLIPFTVFIPPEKRDKKLPLKLSEELPGILNWALVGLGLWREFGLRPPPEVLDATEGYRVEMDLLHDFLQTCCEDEPGSFVTAEVLFEVYEEWAKENGESPVSKRGFGIMMRERGYKPEVQYVDNKQKRGYADLKITEYLNLL